MAGSVNKVILVGNLGRDPEVRNTQDGTEDRPSGGRDLGSLARPQQRREPRAHRVAPRGDLQRAPRRGRREIPLQRPLGLSRGRAADPQMDRPVRPGALHHRGRAAALPGRAGAARRPRRRRRERAGRRRHGRLGPNAGPARRAAAGGGGGGGAPAPAAEVGQSSTIWTTRSRSERPGRRPLHSSGATPSCVPTRSSSQRASAVWSASVPSAASA